MNIASHFRSLITRANPSQARESEAATAPSDSVCQSPAEKPLGLIPRTLMNIGEGAARLGTSGCTGLGLEVGAIDGCVQSTASPLNQVLYMGIGAMFGAHLGVEASKGNKAQVGSSLLWVAAGVASFGAASALGASSTMQTLALVIGVLGSSRFLDKQAEIAAQDARRPPLSEGFKCLGTLPRVL